jgi:hypothetical protein
MVVTLPQNNLMGQYTKKQIEQWVLQYKSSGKSISEFSGDKPFSKTSLYNWVSKQNTGSIEAKNPTSSFVQIQAPRIGVPTPNAVIHLNNGIEIKLYEAISDEILFKLAQLYR